MLFGDSITQGASQSGWFTKANQQAGSVTTEVRNAGIGGQRTDQMLARVTSDVIAYRPDITIVNGGGNDITQGRTAQQVIDSLSGIFDALQAAGSLIIATTVLPSTFMDQASEQSAIAAVNDWVRSNYDSWSGAYLADFNEVMSAGSEWIPVDGATSDGVHPNSVGGSLMAGALTPVLIAAAADA